MLIRIKHVYPNALELTPVSKRRQEKYSKHMREYFPSHDGAVFLQSQEEIESLRQFMSRHSYNEVVSGISAIYRMDAETYGYLLGYDAHLI
jgi:hypothetical protein